MADFKSFFPELNAITQDGYGHTFKYYPASSKVLIKLKPVSKVIARVITVLSDKGQNEAGSTSRRWQSTKEDETSGDEVVINPVSESMASFRLKQKEKAVQDLIDILLAEDSQAILGYMIMNSMRDEFPDRNPEPKECVAFVTHEDMTVEFLKFHILGLLEANKSVLGPLGGKASSLLNLKTLSDEDPQEEDSKSSEVRKKKKKVKETDYGQI